MINSLCELVVVSGSYGLPPMRSALLLRYLGLYYYKARMYSPALGRFLQTDPVGTADDLNLYAYVGNNPVNYTDPTGEWAVMRAMVSN
ncbi:RHS repeat-associated core domain-containing protein [Paraburkholderia sediminicola]|uniref:RHS repeat-associated core domain-containing protein n=1 Tax=Paraburkholderia sediminicola TaxID=458836 RepID=UPI0038BCC9AF